MKLLLTSNGFFTQEIKEQFLNSLQGNYTEKKVVILTTASPQKEHNRFAQKAKEDFFQMGFQDIVFMDIEHEDPLLLLKADILYINGGNPFKLLHHIKKTHADEVLREVASKEGVMIGVSAGAVVLGTHIGVVQHFTPFMNVCNLKDLTALGLTNTLVFPHYDREDLFPDDTGKSIETRIQEFECLHSCKVERISDDGFLLLNGTEEKR